MKNDFEVINHISKLKIEYFNKFFSDVNIHYDRRMALYYSSFGEIKALFDIAELLTGYVFTYCSILDYLNSGKAISIHDFIERRMIKKWTLIITR